MFNIFTQKNKKNTVAKKDKKTQQMAKKSPDQNINLAAEKLEATLRNLKVGKTGSSNSPPADKQKLINEAIAVQKAQSKLLDGLDENTRQRLKALALELMVFNKQNKP